MAKDNKVYFVVETKGNLSELNRIKNKNHKIECDKKHCKLFNVAYKEATNINNIL
ncbi:restriction endonuclease [Campylobacter canadensis]|uniref:restriction endonuclease n=1 Tax=Campylobacter canadensis TaxID=449520 RepID=UPI001CCD73A9